MSASAKPNEICITRVFSAPLDVVWDAWTDLDQVVQWWGPRGFTLTSHSKDLRPGGIWHYTMHGPDGVDYPNKTLYLEVEEQKKLVYDHGGNDEREPMFRVTVLFTAVGKKTRMEMTMALATAEAAEATRKLIREAGGNSTWDRLAEYLDKQICGKEHFVINRSFAAPLELMFEMWTNPEHMAKWLPPAGFEIQFLRSDIRPGGSTFYLMTNNAGVTMYGRSAYQEITKPNRLIFTQEFCDKDENVSRHPLAPVWPAMMLTTVELTAEGSDNTRVTVTTEAIGDVSAEELKAFIDARGGMTQGWTGSFDKLDELLANL